MDVEKWSIRDGELMRFYHKSSLLKPRDTSFVMIDTLFTICQLSYRS